MDGLFHLIIFLLSHFRHSFAEYVNKPRGKIVKEFNSPISADDMNVPVFIDISLEEQVMN